LSGRLCAAFFPEPGANLNFIRRLGAPVPAIAKALAAVRLWCLGFDPEMAWP